MFDRACFIEILKANHMTQEVVSKALSIDGSTLYRKMAGISDFTLSEIRELRKLLSLTMEEVEAVFF